MFQTLNKNLGAVNLVFDDISDVVLFVSQGEDGSFCLIDANKAAIREMRLPENFISKDIQMVIPEFKPNLLIQKCKEAILTKQTIIFETNVKLNTNCWLESKVIPIFEVGTFKYIIVICHDITNRKIKERELSLEKEKLELIFDHAADAVFTFDLNGDYVAVNKGYTNLFGWTEEEVLSDPKITILPSRLERDFEEVLEQLKKGQIIENHQALRVTKNGTLIHVLSSYAPMFEDGKLIGGVAIYKDITELNKMAEQLRDSESRYRLIAEYSSDLIQMLDPNGITIYASPSHEHHFGLSPEFYLNKSILTFAHEDDKEKLAEFLREINISKAPQSIEYRRFYKIGETIWMDARGTPILDDDGNVKRIIFTSRDICKQKEREQQFIYQALHDELTNLPNRRMFEDCLIFAMNLTKRSRHPLAILTIDFDNFKFVNDTYGHAVGDQVLKTLANRINSTIRGSDTVSRVGGDEFLVILPELENNEEAITVANRILSTIERIILVKGIAVQLTASIGISYYDGGEEKDKETLLKEADIALYAAKRNGKSAYSIFH